MNFIHGNDLLHLRPIPENYQLCQLLINIRFSTANGFANSPFLRAYVLMAWNGPGFEYYFEPYIADAVFKELLTLSRVIFIILTRGSRSFTNFENIRCLIPRSRLPTGINIPTGMPPPFLNSRFENPLLCRGPLARLEDVWNRHIATLAEGLQFLALLMNHTCTDRRYPWAWILQDRSYTEDIDPFLVPMGLYRVNSTYHIINHPSLVSDRTPFSRICISLDNMFNILDTHDTVDEEDDYRPAGETEVIGITTELLNFISRLRFDPNTGGYYLIPNNEEELEGKIPICSDDHSNRTHTDIPELTLDPGTPSSRSGELYESDSDDSNSSDYHTASTGQERNIPGLDYPVCHTMAASVSEETLDQGQYNCSSILTPTNYASNSSAFSHSPSNDFLLYEPTYDRETEQDMKKEDANSYSSLNQASDSTQVRTI
jgi:hypothetical protein